MTDSNSSSSTGFDAFDLHPKLMRGIRAAKFETPRPIQTETIPAEFEGLEDHTVAVVIFASETTQYEYPWAVMNLSAMISSNIVANVEGAKTISPQKISAYQRKNLHWMEMGR